MLLSTGMMVCPSLPKCILWWKVSLLLLWRKWWSLFMLWSVVATSISVFTTTTTTISSTMVRGALLHPLCCLSFLCYDFDDENIFNRIIILRCEKHIIIYDSLYIFSLCHFLQNDYWDGFGLCREEGVYLHVEFLIRWFHKH